MPGHFLRHEHGAQRNTFLVGIEKSASMYPVDATKNQARRTLLALEVESLLDGFRREFDNLFRANSNSTGLNVFDQAGLLGDKGIDAVGGYYNIGVHLIASDNLSLLLDEVIHSNVANNCSTNLLGLACKPWIKYCP